MKKLIYLLLIFLTFQCQKNQSGKKSIAEEYNYINQKNTNVERNNNDQEVDSLLESSKEMQDDKLIGLIIIDSTANSDSKKFGLDISNACYSCNLATLKIDNENISIENYCDSTEITKFKIVKVIKTEKPFEVQVFTKDAKFSFSRGENSLHFKLSVVGKLKTSLIISEYYTFKLNLPSYFIHDCQNFEG